MTLLELLNIVKQKLKWVIAVPLVCALLCAGITAFLLPEKYSATATINVTAEAGSVGSIAEQTANEIASLNGVTVKEKTDTTAKSISLTVSGSNSSAVLSTLEASVEQTQEEVTNIYAEKVVLNSSIPQAAINESPSPVKYGAVALVAGLFVVICAIVIADMIKRPIHSAEEVEEAYEIKCLGSCTAVQGLNQDFYRNNSSQAKHGKGTTDGSLQEASVLSLSSEALLANLKFASNSAQSFCIIPASPSNNALPVINELRHAAQADNLVAEFKEVDIAERSLESYVANSNKYGRIVFLACKSVEEGVGASYAANAAEATVLVLSLEQTTHKQLQETIHQLDIAKANVIGFVTVSQLHK